MDGQPHLNRLPLGHFQYNLIEWFDEDMLYPGQQCPDSFLAYSTFCLHVNDHDYLQAIYQQITAPARVQVFNHHANFTD